LFKVFITKSIEENMISKTMVFALSIFSCTTFAFADDTAVPKDALQSAIEQAPPHLPVKTVTPVFGQLILRSLPKGFKPAFENTAGNQYIHESVLTGESVEKWTQMITLTGVKGLSANSNATPQKFANGIGGGYKQACPESYSATGIGPGRIGGFDAYTAILSCGEAPSKGEPYSESMLLVVIKGESDYYTIQWAERGTASKLPIKVDHAKWIERMKSMSPINLCPIMAGESSPYTSCINRL
jgi:hypothetical protein